MKKSSFGTCITDSTFHDVSVQLRTSFTFVVGYATCQRRTIVYMYVHILFLI